MTAALCAVPKAPAPLLPGEPRPPFQHPLLLAGPRSHVSPDMPSTLGT